MPQRDKTGPDGEGRTGRGRGDCDKPIIRTPKTDRNNDLGRGRGGGRRRVQNLSLFGGEAGNRESAKV